jgi:FkbM family methyltransferase
MSLLRSTYRRVRRTVRRATGRDVHFPVQTRVPAERHGSEYGGWWICPRGLAPGAVVYSVGIGTDITFDLSLIETYGVTVHAFDPTPGSIVYVRSQPLPNSFNWHEIGVAGHDGPATFFPPINPAHISHTLVARAETSARAIQVEVRRLSTIMRDLGHQTLDVLKMDIEGAEYDVLDEVLERGLAIGQILVEFHHRFPGIGVDRTRRAVHDLNAAGYRIFFASDSGEEYSFILDPGSDQARRDSGGRTPSER